MKQNTAVNIGSLALIEKVNGEHQFFPRIFKGIGEKARSLTSSTKLLIYNRLDECFSISAQKRRSSDNLIWGKNIT